MCVCTYCQGFFMRLHKIFCKCINFLLLMHCFCDIMIIAEVIKVDLYDRIDVLLKAMNSNRTKMCETIGISYNTLSSLYKRRSKNMDLETIQKIALYLGTTVEYLFTGNEKPATTISNLVVVYDKNGTKLEYQLETEQLDAILTILEGMKNNK